MRRQGYDESPHGNKDILRWLPSESKGFDRAQAGPLETANTDPYAGHVDSGTETTGSGTYASTQQAAHRSLTGLASKRCRGDVFDAVIVYFFTRRCMASELRCSPLAFGNSAVALHLVGSLLQPLKIRAVRLQNG